eukprot:666797-Pleurochrysis_carterae.AAC.2
MHNTFDIYAHLKIHYIVHILILIKSSARQLRIGGIGNSHPVATSVPRLDRCIADKSIRAIGCAASPIQYKIMYSPMGDSRGSV